MCSKVVCCMVVLFSATSAFSRAAVPESFLKPSSEAVDLVNPLIGNGGPEPNLSGGMIPSTAPPFGMTRWVAQTRRNYVSAVPYNYSDTTIHGFQGTHQPAIWMGESAQVVVVPGMGRPIKSLFEERGMTFSHEDEAVSPSYYSAQLRHPTSGMIFAEQSATSRVGHLRFTFNSSQAPYVLVEATRPTILGSPASPSSRIFYPFGTISIDPARREVCGTNPERQDMIIGPISTPATRFRGHFCARFDVEFSDWGVAQNGSVSDGVKDGEGGALSAYVRFPPSVKVVDVRVGVSFISTDQARRNMDKEIPDGTTLEETAKRTRDAWKEKLDRIVIEGASREQKEIFYTAFYHTLQYPCEQSEDGWYYSGFDDEVHQGESYTAYSIWDTYRATWAWQILLAPERIPDMITSMLQDYKEGGWLPMWKNIIETNIMIGTHADSLIAEAIAKGITDFDLEMAYEAVYKDATVPPDNDGNTSYYDREENVDYEVRAGLSSVYASKGWVANDLHSESASRTLDYAYNDYSVSVFASYLNKTDDAAFFLARALTSPYTLLNAETGFMEARNADGSWAGEAEGWTEGDKWAYSFDVVHDVPGLIEKMGGNEQFVEFLDRHFDEGHNDHTNEPSHHIPYLYSLAGAPWKAQERIRSIAKTDYNNAVDGLSGNEDCGQMSAWYIFSALGFYPVSPASAEYIIGSPFFEKVTIHLPGPGNRTLVVSSKDAPKKPYATGANIDGQPLQEPKIRHEQIANGGEIIFEMSERPDGWFTTVTPSATLAEQVLQPGQQTWHTRREEL